MVRWLNTPCTDPAGRVFAADGRVFRAVFPGKERAVLSVADVAALAATPPDKRERQARARPRGERSRRQVFSLRDRALKVERNEEPLE
jgi:hypothetical protein